MISTRTISTALAALAAIAFLFQPPAARAIGPHEIALVVNNESIDSVLLAKTYKRLRSIPDSNLIRVSIPESVYNVADTDISHADFTEHIWKPLAKMLENPDLRHIQGIVFSCGFPTKVLTTPPVSITGAVFLRNKFPASGKDDLWKEIDNGRYMSELYAGPVNPNKTIGESETFDTSRARLLANMPLPAMMLAFVGNRGTTVEQAQEYLARAAASDHTQPAGSVWFAVNNDVRSNCRLWEFGSATNELSRIPGIRATVSTNKPTRADYPLVGYMTGISSIDTAAFEFAPGAFAEHLTSWGAAFDQASQTKVTDWLVNGAAFTAGTVTEPYAIWMKFPHACIFTHYVNGCSAIEALYLSVLSPLQTLPLGDPLTKPWAEKIDVRIESPEGDLSGSVEFTAVIENERPDVFYRFQWLVDGRQTGTSRTLVWDTRPVRNGSHTIRVIVRRQLEKVRPQGFDEITVKVQNKK